MRIVYWAVGSPQVIQESSEDVVRTFDYLLVDGNENRSVCTYALFTIIQSVHIHFFMRGSRRKHGLKVALEICVVGGGESYAYSNFIQ